MERLNWPSALLTFSMIVAWVCGIAVAKGFWMTLLCFMLPPVAWVVLAMRYLP